MKTVDLVIPCYNESEMIDMFFQRTQKVISQINGYQFTFIFVDDGSNDDTLIKIKELGENQKNIRYISFSRNFGKEAAMYAGIKASTGERLAIMDADLQHPPELLGEMLKAIDKEGYDSCGARRVNRKGEPKIRSGFARLFYKLMNRFSDVDIIDGAVDFRMMTRQMVNAILDMPEVKRFSKGIFSWVGFSTKWVEFANEKRVAGESNWSFWSLLRYAMDGLLDFATFPLKFFAGMGGVAATAAFVYLVIEIIKTLAFGKDVPGYASLISVILFIGGLIIMTLSLMGEYLARMYMEVKRRPIYIEKESNMEKEVYEK
ncbi:MAG: glycosyltransferase family 2 protein [Anaerovoracaceae bacterium]